MTYLGPRPLTTTTPSQPLRVATGSRPAPSQSLRVAAGSRPAPSQPLRVATGSRPAPSQPLHVAAGSRPAPSQPLHVAAGSRPAPSQPFRVAAGSRPAPSQPLRVAAGSRPAPSQPLRVATGSRPAPSQPLHVAAGSRPAPSQPLRVAAGSRPAPAQLQRAGELDGRLLAFTAIRNAAKVAFWRKEAQSYDRECCELMNMLASAETRAWDLGIELEDERDAHLKVQSRLQLVENELVALRLAAARAASSSNTRIIAESEAAEHARFSAKFAHVQPYVTITD